ncbi:MAG: hypothetical protein PHU85_17030 [Phycisphaerae bacterium]|jgi:hypothetical protein|nr:hypothetical protein [Phycisphaerae bacterium]
MSAALALGLGLGIVIGAAGGAALIWLGMRLHERIVWSVREDRPAFSESDAPLEHGFTDEENEP